MFLSALCCHSCSPTSGSAGAQWAQAQVMCAAPRLRKLLQLKATSLFHWDYLKKTPCHLTTSHDSGIAARFISKLLPWQIVAGWFTPYSHESPDLPGITPIRLGRVLRNPRSAWEHLGKAEAAEEGGFVTGPETLIGVLQGKRDTNVLLGTSRVCSSESSTCISPSLHELPEEGTHRLFGAVINTVLKKEDKPSIWTPTEQRNPECQVDSIESTYWAAFELRLNFLTRLG